MEWIITIVSVLIVIIALFALLLSYHKRKYQILEVRIEEAVKNIEFFLEKKEKNLKKAIPIIKDSNKRKYGKKEILPDLIKNKNIKQSLKEKDESLRNDLKEFKEYLEEDEKLAKNKALSEIYFDSIEIENDLNASKKYYNKVAKKIEDDFKKFPKNSLKKFLKYKPLEKMNTKKEETLEILKEETSQEKK